MHGEHPDGNPFAEQDRMAERGGFLGSMLARAAAENPSVALEYGLDSTSSTKAGKRARSSLTSEEEESEDTGKRHHHHETVRRRVAAPSSSDQEAATAAAAAPLARAKPQDEDEEMSETNPTETREGSVMETTDAEQQQQQQRGASHDEQDESEADDDDDDDEDDEDEDGASSTGEQKKPGEEEEDDDDDDEDEEDDSDDSDDSSSDLSSVAGSRHTSPAPALPNGTASIEHAAPEASTSTAPPKEKSPVKKKDKDPEAKAKKAKVRRLRTPTPPPKPKDAKTIRLSIPLVREKDAAEFDITRMAVAAGFIEPDDAEQAQASKNAEQAKVPGKAGSVPPPPPKKKRKRKILGRHGGYDTDDSFVDDSEIQLYEPKFYTRPKQDGFFVATGEVEIYKRGRKKNDSATTQGAANGTAESSTAARGSSAKPTPPAHFGDKLPKVSSVPAFGSTSGSSKPTTAKQPRVRPDGTFDRELRKALDEFRADAAKSDFSQKGKFPPELRPKISTLAMLAYEKNEYDEGFFQEMTKILPYNGFTVKKLIKREVFPKRVEQLRATQAAWMQDIKKMVEERLPAIREEYEKQLKEWEEENERARKEGSEHKQAEAPKENGEATSKNDGEQLLSAPQTNGATAASAPPSSEKGTEDVEMKDETKNESKTASATTGREGAESTPAPGEEAKPATSTSDRPPKPQPKFRFNEEVRTAIYNIWAAEMEITELTQEKQELEKATTREDNPQKPYSGPNAIKAMYAKLVELWPDDMVDSNRLSREVSTAKKKIQREQNRD